MCAGHFRVGVLVCEWADLGPEQRLEKGVGAVGSGGTVTEDGSVKGHLPSGHCWCSQHGARPGGNWEGAQTRASLL